MMITAVKEEDLEGSEEDVDPEVHDANKYSLVKK